MSLLPLPLTPIMHRHSDFEEVSRRLEISIRNGTHTAIGKNKIQKRTVTFEENRLEVEFRRLHDEFFKTNLAIALFLGLLLIICQFLIRPYSELSIIVYIGAGVYLGNLKFIHALNQNLLFSIWNNIAAHNTWRSERKPRLDYWRR